MSIKSIINDYISTIMDKNIDIKNPTKWNLIKENIEAYIKKENNIKLFNKKFLIFSLYLLIYVKNNH